MKIRIIVSRMCGGWWPWIDYDLDIAGQWRRFEAFRSACPAYDSCRGFPDSGMAKQCGEDFARSEGFEVELEVRQ